MNHRVTSGFSAPGIICLIALVLAPLLPVAAPALAAQPASTFQVYLPLITRPAGSGPVISVSPFQFAGDDLNFVNQGTPIAAGTLKLSARVTVSNAASQIVIYTWQRPNGHGGLADDFPQQNTDRETITISNNNLPMETGTYTFECTINNTVYQTGTVVLQ